MRTLLQEMEDIQNGKWDDRLTAPYILMQPSEDPTKAIYAHKESSAAQPPVTNTTGGPAEPAPGSVLSPVSPVRRSSRSSRSPTRRSTATNDASHPSQEATIAEVAEREAEQAAEGLEDSMTEEAVQHPAATAEQLADIPEEAEEVEAVQGTSRKSTTKASSKPPIAERRSSTRASRNSITNLSEIVTPTTSTSGSAVPPLEEPTEQAASPKSAAMEHDSSRDSQPSTSAPKKGTRGSRRSSLPRDTSKRKRATTPLDARGPSPAVSDRSRNKRVKTEEPESSVGTPAAEQDRTPSSSEAAARRFRNSAPLLVSQMQSNIRSNFFKDPVRPGEALNYFDIVKRPMDLKTLLQGIKSGRVTSTAEFKRDVAL